MNCCSRSLILICDTSFGQQSCNTPILKEGIGSFFRMSDNILESANSWGASSDTQQSGGTQTAQRFSGLFHVALWSLQVPLSSGLSGSEAIPVCRFASRSRMDKRCRPLWGKLKGWSAGSGSGRLARMLRSSLRFPLFRLCLDAALKAWTSSHQGYRDF